jgi:hypothetical protein
MSIGSSDEESVLDKTIADYRTSGNPGAFILKETLNKASLSTGI